MPTHKVDYSAKYADGTSSLETQLSDSNTAGAELNITESIADGVVDGRVLTGLIDVSQVKSIYVEAPGVLTLELNHASTPTQTIKTEKNNPTIWSTGFTGRVNPLIADFTDIYVTNASGGALVLEVRILYDPTV